jgi:bifunctional non-homologous end joining protein LigD
MADLKPYNAKRNFTKTKEPIGKKASSKNQKLKFVIQHHLARKDHYDLRLEYQGVYVSFAVPKGPSFNPLDKRLAIHVEDHPLSYGNFEGTIPKGEYGGGTVMLFDKGYYTFPKDNPPNFSKGPVKFTLQGKRLKGSWSLVKMQADNWLLIKEKDEYVKKINIQDYQTSIKTGRTMEEITHPQKNSKINLTNPQKLIFQKEKVTKQAIFQYYNQIKNRIMPFLENRLISTVRAPEGTNGEIFFMKHLNNNSKDIGHKTMKTKSTDKTSYYYFKNINGLLLEVQMNSYEFHIWGCLQNAIQKPDILVFDLDPDEGLSLKKVRAGVRDLKQILDNLKLKSYLKTSGGKGYHIYVPLPMTSWQKCEKISSDIANLMVLNHPEKYTTNMRKEKRKNKIFIDYFRNKLGSTSVCPYSLRLKKKATISCPIFWTELDKIKPDGITIKNFKKRLKKKDPWANFFE